MNQVYQLLSAYTLYTGYNYGKLTRPATCNEIAALEDCVAVLRREYSLDLTKPFHLFIRGLEGITYTLTSNPEQNLRLMDMTSFHDLVADKLGSRTYRPRLIYGGKQFVDESDVLLEEYDISSFATIHAVLRIKGD